MDTEANHEPPEAAAAAVDGMVVDDPDVDENAICIRLGNFRDADMLTKAGLAKVLRCSARTLQRMVERFELPPPTNFAGRSIWIVGKLKAWVADAVEVNEAEARKQAKKMYRL
jgi:hypothetical protein